MCEFHIIANLFSGRTCEKRNPQLVQSLTQYRELHPESYHPVERLPCMTQMLVMIAQQAQDNLEKIYTVLIEWRAALDEAHESPAQK